MMIDVDDDDGHNASNDKIQCEDNQRPAQEKK